MKQMIIDQSHSEIGFKVKHLMISTVKGNFQTFSGGVSEDGDVTVSMNVNSINTGSIDRDNHLKSADFFNSEFPLSFFNGDESIFKNGCNASFFAMVYDDGIVFYHLIPACISGRGERINSLKLLRGTRA